VNETNRQTGDRVPKGSRSAAVNAGSGDDAHRRGHAHTAAVTFLLAFVCAFAAAFIYVSATIVRPEESPWHAG
jgi:hypothetical protein